MPTKRQDKGGRPVNPTLPRTHVALDPALKKRALLCAVQDSVPFHKILDAALWQYLAKRGA